MFKHVLNTIYRIFIGGSVLEIARCHLGGFARFLKGNSSYKPPGASYIAQGPQKQPEILYYTFYVLWIMAKTILRMLLLGLLVILLMNHIIAIAIFLL